MNRQANGTNCGIYCWSVGVVSGVLAFVVLWGLLGAAPFVALVLGAALAAGAGLFLVWAFCGPLTEAPRSAVEAPSVAPAAPPVPHDPAPADQPSPQATAPVADAPETKPAAPRPEPLAAPAAAPEPEQAQETRAGPVGAPAGVRLLTHADGEADDLKRIKGVGPALERKLNDLGVFHYAQIAEWGPDEVAWVDGHLNFRGRIDRDDWIAQAKTLAEGGETEFSGRAGGK